MTLVEHLRAVMAERSAALAPKVPHDLPDWPRELVEARANEPARAARVVAIDSEISDLRLELQRTCDVPLLTKRQAEVLIWAARGKTARDTGQILGIATTTVEFHRRQAMDRLCAATLIAAVAKAVSTGEILV